MTHSASELWWTVAKRHPNARLRLFCFPYAGGNAAVFRSWSFELPDEIEVYALQLPGRANRLVEAPFKRLPDLVPVLAQITADLIDRPFAFFGHSLGAVLSFEIARWLRRHRRLVPTHLFVGGRRAPQVPPSEEPNYQKADHELLSSLGALNGTPVEVLRNAELLALMLPTLRADFELIETYQYTDEPPFACPITVVDGSDDPWTEDDGREAWRRQTTGRFAAHVVDGDHFFIHAKADELMRLVQAELVPCLERLHPAPAALTLAR